MTTKTASRNAHEIATDIMAICPATSGPAEHARPSVASLVECAVIRCGEPAVRQALSRVPIGLARTQDDAAVAAWCVLAVRGGDCPEPVVLPCWSSIARIWADCPHSERDPQYRIAARLILAGVTNENWGGWEMGQRARRQAIRINALKCATA